MVPLQDLPVSVQQIHRKQCTHDLDGNFLLGLHRSHSLDENKAKHNWQHPYEDPEADDVYQKLFIYALELNVLEGFADLVDGQLIVQDHFDDVEIELLHKPWWEFARKSFLISLQDHQIVDKHQIPNPLGGVAAESLRAFAHIF